LVVIEEWGIGNREWGIGNREWGGVTLNAGIHSKSGLIYPLFKKAGGAEQAAEVGGQKSLALKGGLYSCRHKG